MTRAEFRKILADNDISASLVQFQNAAEDGFYLLKKRYRWEVSLRERGKDDYCVGFSSESDALEYLLNKLTISKK